MWRHIRIRGIQIARAIHPEATPVDLHILLTAIDPLILQEYSDRELGMRENISEGGVDRGCYDK